MKYLKTVLVVLLFMSSVWAMNTISEFDGWAEETRIIIQWKTTSEDGIEGFEIQRSTDGVNFFEIGFLSAQGHKSGYTFIDDSIIAKVSGRNYYYRLKIRSTLGNVELSDVITIESDISGVNHTWGSLKALFK